jgi:hypothetical protein
VTTSQREVLKAFLAYRDRFRKDGPIDKTDPVDSGLWAAADVPDNGERKNSFNDTEFLSWQGLEQRIRNVERKRARHVESTQRVIRYLLEWHRTTGDVRDSHPPDARLVINCPNTIFDYRAVIVGQLPQFDVERRLYPAVFVKPKGQREYWYPQCNVHNPLCADRAFAVLAHFGNPAGLWTKELPARFDVRAYALLAKWSDSRRLTERALEKKVAPLRDPVLARVNFDVAERIEDQDVTRQAPGIDGIHIRDARRKSFSPTDQETTCKAPLSIVWKGSGSARLEVRSGDGDEKVYDDAIASGVTLVLKHSRPPRAGSLRAPRSSAGPRSSRVQIALPPGPYRLKAYPQKPSFLDPEWEWWIRMR